MAGFVAPRGASPLFSNDDGSGTWTFTTVKTNGQTTYTSVATGKGTNGFGGWWYSVGHDVAGISSADGVVTLARPLDSVFSNQTTLAAVLYDLGTPTADDPNLINNAEVPIYADNPFLGQPISIGEPLGAPYSGHGRFGFPAWPGATEYSPTNPNFYVPSSAGLYVRTPDVTVFATLTRDDIPKFNILSSAFTITIDPAEGGGSPSDGGGGNSNDGSASPGDTGSGGSGTGGDSVAVGIARLFFNAKPKISGDDEKITTRAPRPPARSSSLFSTGC